MSTTASAPAGKANATSAPEILWAQRSSEDEAEKNVVMITINVPNLPPAPATKLDLTEKGFTFHAKVGDKSKGVEDKEYAFEMDLFDEIDTKESKVSQTSKSMYLLLRKKEAKAEFWPRLSKEKIRLHNVKTDFDKWVDEDEQDGAEDLGAAGMDPSAMMGGMGGGMGGMGDMMGGMGGMGGLGGPGGSGMDIQSMLAQMQGGAGGAGGLPDFSSMSGGGEDDDSDDDDDVGGEAPIKPSDADLIGEIDEIQTQGVSKGKDVESVD